MPANHSITNVLSPNFKRVYAASCFMTYAYGLKFIWIGLHAVKLTPIYQLFTVPNAIDISTVSQEPQCAKFRRVFTCSPIVQIHIKQCILPGFVIAAMRQLI